MVFEEDEMKYPFTFKGLLQCRLDGLKQKLKRQVKDFVCRIEGHRLIDKEYLPILVENRKVIIQSCERCGKTIHFIFEDDRSEVPQKTIDIAYGRSILQLLNLQGKALESFPKDAWSLKMIKIDEKASPNEDFRSEDI